MHISIQQAVDLLQGGAVVALPTETVYGLAASLNNARAIEMIFELKGRPRNNPLIIHVAALEDLHSYAENIPDEAAALANAFWPGPLTLVLPTIPGRIPSLVSAGLSTAAFRIPRHPLTNEIIRQVGPLVMPSANLSGKPSATSASHVESDFGQSFPVVDGGLCQSGLESTVMTYDGSKWVVIRYGAIPGEQLAFVLGYVPLFASNINKAAPICPGQMYRHYAPEAHLQLGGVLRPDQSIIGFSNRTYPVSNRKFFLGRDDMPAEVAAQLYSCLRAIDDAGVTDVWVDMDFPRQGLWNAIFDRFTRAASAAEKNNKD